MQLEFCRKAHAGGAFVVGALQETPKYNAHLMRRWGEGSKSRRRKHLIHTYEVRQWMEARGKIPKEVGSQCLPTTVERIASHHRSETSRRPRGGKDKEESGSAPSRWNPEISTITSLERLGGRCCVAIVALDCSCCDGTRQEKEKLEPPEPSSTA